MVREIVGGNGINLETNVSSFFADAEAIYSYEGTHEINALIDGIYLTRLCFFFSFPLLNKERFFYKGSDRIRLIAYSQYIHNYLSLYAR